MSDAIRRNRIEKIKQYEKMKNLIVYLNQIVKEVYLIDKWYQIENRVLKVKFMQLIRGKE